MNAYIYRNSKQLFIDFYVYLLLASYIYIQGNASLMGHTHSYSDIAMHGETRIPRGCYQCISVSF